MKMDAHPVRMPMGVLGVNKRASLKHASADNEGLKAHRMVSEGEVRDAVSAFCFYFVPTRRQARFSLWKGRWRSVLVSSSRDNAA